MSVSIPDSLRPFVSDSISKGWFADESELVAFALMAFEEIVEQHEELSHNVQLSLAQANRGELETFDADQIKNQLLLDLDEHGQPK